jgi:GNAT superfamily N-acetyltransferase
MSYEVVPYSPELHGQLMRLQTHLWSADPARNAAYFRWKYTDNPYLREVLIRVALCAGSAVAMRGMFGTLWEIDDAATHRILPYADDLVVAPAHRNSGVAHRIVQELLSDAAHRGFPYALSLSAGPTTFVASLATGWRSPGSYRIVRRERRERRARPGWSRRLDRLLGRGSRLFDRLDLFGGRAQSPLSLARAARPEAMAELVGRLPWDGRIRHVRDLRYFDWRFRNPLHEYRFLYWDDGGLEGYLVLQRYLSERTDQRCVNIVDWEGADERVRAKLLAAAIEWGNFDSLSAWSVGAGEPVRALLVEHGFTAGESDGLRARHSGLLVRPLAATAQGGRWIIGRRDLLDLANWDLRMLYSMAG